MAGVSSGEERPHGLVEGSGRPGEPKALKQMVSVRFDPPVIQALRGFAEREGQSVSDVVREAVLEYLDERSEVPVRCVTWPLSWTGYTQSPCQQQIYGILS